MLTWKKVPTNRHPGSNPGLWLGRIPGSHQELLVWRALRRHEPDNRDIYPITAWAATQIAEVHYPEVDRIDNGYEAYELQEQVR
jgi:hypothetical protein